MPLPFNVYEFFRFILPGGYIVLVLILYLFVFFNIPVPDQLLSSQSVIYFFAAFILSLVIDSRDMIQYGRGHFLEADYFQKAFASTYLLKRCSSCDKKSSCNARLTKKNFINVWFNLFNEYVPEYTRNMVLTLGYLCRTSFYFHIFSSLFLSIGGITTIVMLILKKFPVGRSYLTLIFLVGLCIITQAIYLSNHVSRRNEKRLVTFFRGLNPYRSVLFVLLAMGMIKSRSRIDEQEETKATGLWRRWLTHCEVQKEWMRINERLLQEKICRQHKEIVINQCEPIEQNFKNVLQFIKDKQIKDLIVKILSMAPKYFWRIPSSSSGKWHPSDEDKVGGKVLHTKRSVYIAYHLARMEELNELEKDLLIGAMIVHDICCQGSEDEASSTTMPEHGLLVQKKTKSLRDSPYYAEIMAIVQAHMGHWGPVKPKKKLEKLAHMADYISSRKAVKIDIDQAIEEIHETTKNEKK